MAGNTEDPNAIYDLFIKWIQQWRPIADIRKPQDLNDGHKLWELLRGVDQKAFHPQHLPKPSPRHYIPKRTNLEHIFNALKADLQVEECLPHLSPDLEAIATVAPIPEINSLLRLCFMAVNKRSEKGPYAHDHPLSAQDMHRIVANVHNNPQSALQDTPSPSALPEAGEDSVYLEERMNQTRAESARVAAMNLDLQEERDRYREERDQLEKELIAAQARSEDSALAANVYNSEVGKAESDKIYELEAIVAARDTTIRVNRDKIWELEKSNANYAADQRSREELLEELDLVKTERTKFERDANAVEHYRRKIASQADFEAQNKLLREEMTKLHDQAARSNKLKDDTLKKSSQEFQSVLKAQEIQLQDYVSVQHRLQFDNDGLMEKNRRLEDENRNYKGDIEELQDKIANASSSSSPTTPKAPNLDLGFNQIRETARELEIIGLKKEIEMLRDRPITPPDIATLQQRFDQALKENSELQQESTDLYQDKLSLETMLTASTSGEQYYDQSTGTRSLTHNVGSLSAYQNLTNSKRLLQEENDLLKRQLIQTKRDLADATTKIAIIDKDKLEAAEEVIKTNSTEVTDLRREIDGLRQLHEETVMDLKRHRELLGKARLDRDNARKLADNQGVIMQKADGANDDVKASLAKIESKLESHADHSTSAELKEYVNDLSEKVVQARKNLLARAQFIKTQADLIREQNARIELLDATDHGAKAKKLKETEILNASLLRENSLMATAWYDLNTRIQQSSVSVASASSARRDMPSGWLGRQRVGVERRQGLGGGRR